MKQIIRIIAAVGLAGCLTLSAMADVTVKVPDGNVMVWSTGDAIPGKPPADASAAIKGVATLVTNKGTIAAFDPKTGLMAYKVTADSSIQFAKADFKFIPQVIVDLTGTGKVPGVQVTVTAPDTAQVKTVDFDGKGQVEFSGVGAGSGAIQVVAKASGSVAKNTVSEVFKPNAKGVMEVSIPVGVDGTASATASGTAGSTAGTGQGATAGANSAQPSAEASGAASGSKDNSEAHGWGKLLGQGLSLFFGVLIVGGVAYGLYWLFTKNPQQVRARLTALGAPIPQDPDPNAYGTAVAVPDPPKATPPSQILLSDAAVTPIGVAAVAAPVASFSTTPGSLVMANGTVFALSGDSTEIGREVATGISLPGESSLSRHHARIDNQGGQWSITDLGSTNGTYVNGARIQSPTPIHVGDSIQFGSVQMKVQA